MQYLLSGRRGFGNAGMFQAEHRYRHIRRIPTPRIVLTLACSVRKRTLPADSPLDLSCYSTSPATPAPVSENVIAAERRRTLPSNVSNLAILACLARLSAHTFFSSHAFRLRRLAARCHCRCTRPPPRATVPSPARTAAPGQPLALRLLCLVLPCTLHDINPTCRSCRAIWATYIPALYAHTGRRRLARVWHAGVHSARLRLPSEGRKMRYTGDVGISLMYMQRS